MLRRELISSKSGCTGAGNVFNPIRSNNTNEGFALFCISCHLNGDRAWGYIDHGRTERLDNGQYFCPLLSRCRNFHQDHFALQVWFISDIPDTDHIHLAVELFDDLLYFIMRSNINDNGNPRYIRVFCCANRDTFDIDLTSRQDSCKAVQNT